MVYITTTEFDLVVELKPSEAFSPEEENTQLLFINRATSLLHLKGDRLP